MILLFILLILHLTDNLNFLSAQSVTDNTSVLDSLSLAKKKKERRKKKFALFANILCMGRAADLYGATALYLI